MYCKFHSLLTVIGGIHSAKAVPCNTGVMSLASGGKHTMFCTLPPHKRRQQAQTTHCVISLSDWLILHAREVPHHSSAMRALRGPHWSPTRTA